MRRRTLALRAPFLLLLALLLTRLVFQSSLLKLLDVPISPVWVFLLVAAALVPALLASASPLPATLAVAVPVILASSYGASRLEWLKTLREFHLADAGLVAPDRLVVAVLALGLAWGMHVLDHGERLAASARERGIAAPEATAARAIVWSRGARAGGIALGIALVLGLLAIIATGILPAFVPAEGVSFIAPLAAATLLGVGALILLGVRKRGDPATADDGQE